MSHIDDFDLLVEQQDQELVRASIVSPFTRLRLDALAQGKPLPQVGQSPGVQQATARLFQTLKRFREPSPPAEEDEGDWCCDETYGEED